MFFISNILAFLLSIEVGIMALLKIVKAGAPILKETASPVKTITKNTKRLLNDMAETMYEAEGVGLAAPQIGKSLQMIVLDDGNGLIELINPELLEASEELQDGPEGCLSVPGKHATVTRPDYAKVRAQDENMEWFELEGEGLLARAICHECDHLDGKLYVDLVEGDLHDVTYTDDEEE